MQTTIVVAHTIIPGLILKPNELYEQVRNVSILATHHVAISIMPRRWQKIAVECKNCGEQFTEDGSTTVNGKEIKMEGRRVIPEAELCRIEYNSNYLC